MVLITPKPSRRRPNTAPGSSVHTTPTSSLDLDSSPGATSGSSSSSLDSPELDFADFLASAPQPGELKIFGEPNAFRPRPLSFFGSSTSTSSSSLSASTSSSASRRFSFRFLSTSASSSSNSDPQPHVAATSHGIGFVRTTTTSGGICYVAEEVHASTAADAAAALSVVEDIAVKTESKIEQVKLDAKQSLPLVRSPNRIPSHTQLWTPPNRAPPPTPPKSTRRHTLSLENAFNTLTLTRRPAPTRLSILNNPPAVLRDLECPPSAWKSSLSSPSSPSSPHSPTAPDSKGTAGRRKKRGDPNVEAAVDWLRARKGTYGGVLRRLKIAVDPVAEGREEEGWVVCESQGGSDGNGSAKKGGNVLGKKEEGGKKGKGKGKKVQLSKTGGAGEKVGWLGREIGGKAPFFLV